MFWLGLEDINLEGACFNLIETLERSYSNYLSRVQTILKCHRIMIRQ